MKAAVELWRGRPQRLVKEISTTPLMRHMRSDSHALVDTKANVLCVFWWTRHCPGATIFLTLKYAALVVVNIGKRKKTEKCTATWNRFNTTAVLQPRTRLIKRLPNAIIPDEWWAACTCHAHWSAISMHCYDCKAKEGEQKKSWPGKHFLHQNKPKANKL